MSLQGTLDTFALPDVLRLLAGTRKTGHLRIDGSRGSGDVWVDTGHVVAARTDTAPSNAGPTEVVFELLRFPDGSFSFDADVTTSNAGAPADVEPLLEASETLLSEWREIERVVPSLAAAVTMAPELPRPTVAVNAEQWRMLVAVAGGTTVGTLGATFELGELDVSRSVKGLVEAGLVEVDATVPAPPVVPAKAARPASPSPTPVAVDPSVVDEGAAAAAAAAVADLAGHPAAVAAPELARQLASLGPEAARAVAAAAEAETPEEREAALASIEGEVDGEPINRGLLLKFLSSVRS